MMNQNHLVCQQALQFKHQQILALPQACIHHLNCSSSEDSAKAAFSKPEQKIKQNWIAKFMLPIAVSCTKY